MEDMLDWLALYLTRWPQWMVVAKITANLALAAGCWTMALLMAVYVRRSGTVLYRRHQTRRVSLVFAAFLAAAGATFFLQGVAGWWPVQRFLLLAQVTAAGLLVVTQACFFPMVRTAQEISPEEATASMTARTDRLIELLTPFADALRSLDDAHRPPGDD